MAVDFLDKTAIAAFSLPQIGNFAAHVKLPRMGIKCCIDFLAKGQLAFLKLSYQYIHHPLDTCRSRLLNESHLII